jgi:[protein-PII] uridylyltransferase
MRSVLTTGLAAARSAHVDALVTPLASDLSSAALVALGAYGRQQLTPRADVEILFLHRGNLSAAEVAQRVCYPLWEQAIHVEPIVLTLDALNADARRSWASTSRLLDARFVAGDEGLFHELETRLQPVRRDRKQLKHRIRLEIVERHAAHPSPTCASTPDLVAGRGGLLDLQALRWLEEPPDPRTVEALQFLLATVSAAEDLSGHAVHQLSPRLREQLDPDLLKHLFAHARWVAFALDSALSPEREDRVFGPVFNLTRNHLVAERPPPLERAPTPGLRLANLVGLAPPSPELLDWASREGPPLAWEESTLDQFWLLLRAADWRTWDFLDVSGLLVRFLPELASIWRQPGSTLTGDLAVDSHAFLALRRLHETGESDNTLARRAWRAARQRDPVYLAVLLHHLDADAIASVAERMHLPQGLADDLQFAATSYQSLLDTATRRDLNDEDLVLALASRIGTRQRLGMLFLVALAHEQANGSGAWSPWKADLVRQLFSALDIALRAHTGSGGRRTNQLVEQRRERIIRVLYRRNLPDLVRHVARLPRRYILTRTPEVAARHLTLLQRGPLEHGEVRMQASRRREPGLWDLLVVARDRPGLLATLAGVLALRGASVLGADAATSSDGLVLDGFSVWSAEPLNWPRIEADLDLAMQGRIPLDDLLGSREMPPEEAEAIHVTIDNAASQSFSVVEVRSPDQVGLLYRIASALHAEQLDIQHARIATHPDGAFDVFYVRDLHGHPLNDEAAKQVAASVTTRLRSGTL